MRQLDEPSRDGLPLVVAINGIVDAGRCATAVGTGLLVAGNARTLLEFETDALYDYRQHRGGARIVNGRVVGVALPALALFECTDEESEPFLLLTGNEPDMAWNGLVSAVAEFCDRFSVSRIAIVGGLPWASPHTRPIRFVATGTNPLLNAGHPQPRPDLTAPLTIGALLEMAASERRPVFSVFAQVPQYAANEQFDPAVVELLRLLGRQTGRRFSEDGLNPESVVARLDRHTRAYPPLRGLVATLEMHYDQLGRTGPDSLPDAEALAAQVQAYLAEQE